MTGPEPVAGPNPMRRWVVAAAVVAVVYLLLILLTFRDYGITYDEPLQASYGEHIITWYQTLFQNRDVLSLKDLQYYGGMFDMVAQAAWRLSPLGKYETRHLVNALFGLLGVVALWRIGVRLGGPRLGFLAALFLLLVPAWYGHSFNNPKDIPFAAMYLLAVEAILAVVQAFPRLPWARWAWAGAAIGLTLAVRFGGVVLFGCLGAATGLSLLTHPERPQGWKALGRGLTRIVPRAGLMVVIAWAVMLPWWPAAMVDPLGQPLRTFQSLGHFDWPYPVLVAGRQILATDLPWTYLPRYALVTFPAFLLIGIALAAGWAIRSVKRGAALPRGDDSGRTVAWWTVLLAAAVPPVYAILTHAVLYDGLRHFLFVVPLLALFAADGWSRWVFRPGVPALIGLGILVLALGTTAVDMVRIHPYQYAWFNRPFGGGLRGAIGVYETDYWGVAYKEGAEWIAATYPGGVEGRRLRVATCLQRLSTEYYLPSDRFQIVSRTEEPDLILSGVRGGCDRAVPGRVVHRVERLGATLLHVRQPGTFTPAR